MRSSAHATRRLAALLVSCAAFKRWWLWLRVLHEAQALQMSDGAHFYPVGYPLASWGESERSAWLAHVGPPRRSYAADVIAKLEPLKETFDVVQYGALSQDPGRYPLFCVKTRNWDASKPCALITGGVHGYETRYDGVLCCFCIIFWPAECTVRFFSFRNARWCSARCLLRFLLSCISVDFCVQAFNIAVCPCVCPWGYETIQRWTSKAIDPNRFFIASSRSPL